MIFILNDIAKCMKLLENYNSARQKYGERIVKELSDIGIPPQYLLSDCRFFQKGIDIKDKDQKRLFH